jgi:hypothetical protein
MFAGAELGLIPARKRDDDGGGGRSGRAGAHASSRTFGSSAGKKSDGKNATPHGEGVLGEAIIRLERRELRAVPEEVLYPKS